MADYNESEPVMLDVPLESEDKSQHIGLNSVNVKFSQDIIAVEVANNSDTATIYLNIDGTAAVLSKGIPIYSKCYYVASRKILLNTGICLISDAANTDVRIIGHFNFESELRP